MELIVLEQPSVNPRLGTAKDKAVVLVVFIAVLAGGLMFQLFRANGAGQVPPPANPPVKPSAAREFRGITLQLHSGWEQHPFEEYIDQIARSSANTISLVIPCYQENGSSTSIFVDLRKAPSDKRLIHLIGYARKRNLRITLMPIVLLEDAREDEWRGKISPDDWDRWWDNYTDIVTRYARIAESERIEVFIIGSELISTETQGKRWRELIAKVRQVYRGRLCYSANWDHYRPIDWWDKLDIVGMTTYYDLTGGKKPTVERLLKAWEPIKKEILEWQGKVNRPIMFTEVGWPNQDTCAQYPWNYYASTTADPQAQANCFEAFFRTWINEPTVAGFLVWEWQNHPKQKTGPEDIGYLPCGKPAMKVIRRYFQMPSPNNPTSKAGKRSPAARPAKN
jgi:hypothetical protein